MFKQIHHLKPKDIVYVHYKNGFYAIIENVTQRYYTKEEEQDHKTYCRGKCPVGSYCPKEGERYGDLVKVKKVYDNKLNPVNGKKYESSYDELYLTKVDESFIFQKERELDKLYEIVKSAGININK